MNKIELYVDFGNGNTLLDCPEGGVQINIQSKNYEDIKDEVADYSQNIKMPLTNRNIEAFEYLHIFENNEASIADRWHDCRLYMNGYEVLGNGSKMRIVSIVKDGVNIQLVGSKKTFFEALKGQGEEEKKLNDLSFNESVFRKTRGYGGLHDINTSAEWVKVFYGVAEFGSDTNDGVTLGSNSDAESVFDPKQAYPCVKYDSVLRQIISEAGYTLNGSLGREYDYMCIPLCGINKQLDQGESSAETIDFAATHSNFIAYEAILVNGMWKKKTPPYIQKNATLESAGFVKKITVSVNPKLLEKEFYVAIQLELQGNVQKAYKSYIINKQNTEITDPTLIDSTLIDSFSVRIKPNFPSFTHNNATYITPFVIEVTQLDVRLEYSAVDSEDLVVPVGESIPVKGNLPDMTCDEFFRAHVNLFGLTIKVDEDAKIVYFRTLQQIADNKDVAVDWSEKYNNGTGTFFRYLDGYAHRNEITYEESDAASEEVEDLNIVKVNEFYARLYYNSGIPVLYSDGNSWMRCTTSVPEEQQSYAVPKSATDGGSVRLKDNAFLSADCEINGDDKAVIELPWQSVGFRMVNMDSWRTTAPHIPVADEDGGLANADADFKHILVYSDVSYTIPVKDDEGNTIWAVKKLPFLGTSHASEQGDYGIRAEELRRNYYGVLEDNMLHEAKRIEDAEFWLTDIDIANFDPFKPVYVAKFGAYFVVNKIKNYESGKLTKVDLIKI